VILEKDGYIIKRLDLDIWEVISPKGEVYHVWINHNGTFKCTCPYHVHNKGKKECKHIKMVKETYGIE